MPYVDRTTRKDWNCYVDPLVAAIEHTTLPVTAGLLNYIITLVLRAYERREGRSYTVICTIMGTLICAAFEFYRRVAAPYEDTKINLNGDVK